MKSNIQIELEKEIEIERSEELVDGYKTIYLGGYAVKAIQDDINLAKKAILDQDSIMLIIMLKTLKMNK